MKIKKIIVYLLIVIILSGCKKNETVDENEVKDLSKIEYNFEYNLNGGNSEKQIEKAFANENIYIKTPGKYCIYFFKEGDKYIDTKVIIANFKGWKITGLDNYTHKYGDKTSNEDTLENVLENNFSYLRETPGTITFTAMWDEVSFELPIINDEGKTCVWSKSIDNTSNSYNSGEKYTMKDEDSGTIYFYKICK